MPSTQLTTAYRVALERQDEARRNLVTLLEPMAIETLADVLPGAACLDAVGEIDEEWIPTLGIERVLSASGEVLFDASRGQLGPRAVEDGVDTLNVEYLDVLIDITGDACMGSVTIG
jgi:hypothetical protein